MISPFAGRDLLSRPTAEAGSACHRACRSPAPRSAQPTSRAGPASALRRAVPTRRVPTSARARPPRGDHAPATPAARQPWPASPSSARLLLPASAVLPTPLPHSLSSSDRSSNSPRVRHELRHQLPHRIWLARPPQLAGDHSVSPAAPPSPRARVTSPW